MSTPRRLRVIVAGTYRQFEDWCRESGINPKHPGMHGVLYAGSEETLQGLAPGSADVIYTGLPVARSSRFCELLETISAAPAAGDEHLLRERTRFESD